MKYEAEKGDSIYTAARKAIRLAKSEARDVELIFNEISIMVSPLSYDIDIGTIYSLKSKLRQLEK